MYRSKQFIPYLESLPSPIQPPYENDLTEDEEDNENAFHL